MTGNRKKDDNFTQTLNLKLSTLASTYSVMEIIMQCVLIMIHSPKMHKAFG